MQGQPSWVNNLDPMNDMGSFFSTGDPLHGMSPMGALVGWTAISQVEGALTKGASAGIVSPFFGIGNSLIPKSWRNAIPTHSFKRITPAIPRSFRAGGWTEFGGKVALGAAPAEWMKKGRIGKFLGSSAGQRTLGLAGTGLKFISGLFGAQFMSIGGDLAGGGLRALSEYGGQPMTKSHSVGGLYPAFYDTSAAATMRQQSLMAVRQSQSALGSWFGREAMAVHR